MFYPTVSFPVRLKVLFFTVAHAAQVFLQICFRKKYAGAERTLEMLVHVVVLSQDSSPSSQFFNYTHGLVNVYVYFFAVQF